MSDHRIIGVQEAVDFMDKIGINARYKYNSLGRMCGLKLYETNNIDRTKKRFSDLIKNNKIVEVFFASFEKTEGRLVALSKIPLKYPTVYESYEIPSLLFQVSLAEMYMADKGLVGKIRFEDFEATLYLSAEISSHKEQTKQQKDKEVK